MTNKILIDEAVVRQALESLEQLSGSPDDPNNGWRGTGGTEELFACEYCGQKHSDCTRIEHKPSCPVPKAYPAITALRQALSDAALDKMADNARELGLTYDAPVAQIDTSPERVEKEAGNKDVRPPNFGTGYCSCIECLFEQPAPAQEPEPDENAPEDLLLRGILASELKCWYRLSEDEARNLIAFVKNMPSKSAPAQEPVAWMTHSNDPLPMFHKTRAAAVNWDLQPTPLYTAPPAPAQEPAAFEEWLAKQHGDPEELGFLQALRIAYIAGQDSTTPPAPAEPDPDELTIAYMSGLHEGKKIGAKDSRNKLATWMMQCGFATGHGDTIEELLDELDTEVEARLAAKEWVGLTDEEIAQGRKESWVTEQAWQSAVWWAENKLKEKNTKGGAA